MTQHLEVDMENTVKGAGSRKSSAFITVAPTAAWTSIMHTPTSDFPINHRQYTNVASNNNRMMARRASVRHSSAGEATQLDISAVPDVDIELMSNRGSRAPRLERNISRAMERNMSQASGRFELMNSLAMRRSRGLEEHDVDDYDDDSDETPKSAEHKEGESINGDEEKRKAMKGRRP
ncbi:RING-type domain-containing protein [Abeliophyllum distichum]|uniref:RING-type domain-containing protein n=1 Tax=Abeliophyllum distichum TaxID=126358 RepID=A0ABD1Q3B3_9LAMI